MPELTLKYINPVVLSTHVDSLGYLHISHDGTVLEAPLDTIVVGLASPSGGGPVAASFRIMDPNGGGPLQVLHKDDREQPVHWTRIESGCTYTMSETSYNHAMTARNTAEADEAKSHRTVYIKVKPVEDLPDEP